MKPLAAALCNRDSCGIGLQVLSVLVKVFLKPWEQSLQLFFWKNKVGSPLAANLRSGQSRLIKMAIVMVMQES